MLASDEDGDRGSAGHKLGCGIDGGSECCAESTQWELSLVWQGSLQKNCWGQDSGLS